MQDVATSYYLDPRFLPESPSGDSGTASGTMSSVWDRLRSSPGESSLSHFVGTLGESADRAREESRGEGGEQSNMSSLNSYGGLGSSSLNFSFQPLDSATTTILPSLLPKPILKREMTLAGAEGGDGDRLGSPLRSGSNVPDYRTLSQERKKRKKQVEPKKRSIAAAAAAVIATSTVTKRKKKPRLQEGMVTFTDDEGRMSIVPKGYVPVPLSEFWNIKKHIY
jgi:hypothetical protein